MIQCIIFDLDGTLVDSEPLCNQAFIDLIPELSLTIDEMVLRFRGRKLADIFRDIENIIDRRLPKDFEVIYRAQVDALFASSLETFPNVHQTLQALDIKKCIASSGPQSKICSALIKTGLADLFQGQTFSSYDIGKWKPDPGLFLHAATEMGVAPNSCLVVEDSFVGITAARSAGMMSLHFCNKNSTIDGVDSFDAYNKFADKLLHLSNGI